MMVPAAGGPMDGLAAIVAEEPIGWLGQPEEIARRGILARLAIGKFREQFRSCCGWRAHLR
jgi:hypothetical protein